MFLNLSALSIIGYDRVLSILDRIESSLKATPGARKALAVRYKQKKWLVVTENPTENELVTIALMRIKQDPSQYDEFLTMLCDIEGMDLIVKTLRGHGKVSFACQCVSQKKMDPFSSAAQSHLHLLHHLLLQLNHQLNIH